MQQVDVSLKKCHICGDHKPGTLKYFYANAGNSGGLSKCCKDCADTAKKRYKLKYRRNHADENKGVMLREKHPGLTDRVQYALLTKRCPRCGGRLQTQNDEYSDRAPCMTCMTCSREVWLPPEKVVSEFKSNPPTAVAMPHWVQKERKSKRRKNRSRLHG
jgi:hypothetical protein